MFDQGQSYSSTSGLHEASILRKSFEQFLRSNPYVYFHRGDNSTLEVLEAMQRNLLPQGYDFQIEKYNYDTPAEVVAERLEKAVINGFRSGTLRLYLNQELFASFSKFAARFSYVQQENNSWNILANCSAPTELHASLDSIYAAMPKVEDRYEEVWKALCNKSYELQFSKGRSSDPILLEMAYSIDESLLNGRSEAILSVIKGDFELPSFAALAQAGKRDMQATQKMLAEILLPKLVELMVSKTPTHKICIVQSCICDHQNFGLQRPSEAEAAEKFLITLQATLKNSQPDIQIEVLQEIPQVFKSFTSLEIAKGNTLYIIDRHAIKQTVGSPWDIEYGRLRQFKDNFAHQFPGREDIEVVLSNIRMHAGAIVLPFENGSEDQTFSSFANCRGPFQHIAEDQDSNKVCAQVASEEIDSKMREEFRRSFSR